VYISYDDKSSVLGWQGPLVVNCALQLYTMYRPLCFQGALVVCKDKLLLLAGSKRRTSRTLDRNSFAMTIDGKILIPISDVRRLRSRINVWLMDQSALMGSQP
jgi:hypothetical protein